ncbi:MAG: hypothetical protein ACI8P3_004212, partial [Saprospiraceae bacterium]
LKKNTSHISVGINRRFPEFYIGEFYIMMISPNHNKMF